MADFGPASRLIRLFGLFEDQLAGEVPNFEVIESDEIPHPYRDLLVHHQHMTVTLEKFHGRPVLLRVLAQRMNGDDYGRMILLALEGTGEIVEFGIFRMNLGSCSEEVRSEIVAGRTPLGRILIEHDVLRRIDPSAFLKITPNADMISWFDMSSANPVYGRTANIFCNGMLAIELLEVVRAEPDVGASL